MNNKEKALSSLSYDMETHVQQTEHIKNVSVIIPTYNGRSRIIGAVDSVVKQNYPIFEILIYDDASSDDVQSILAKLEVKHSNINIYRGERNLGAGEARNHMLKKARGDIIAFLDDDDWWHPTKISDQLALMSSNNAHIIISDYEITDERRRSKVKRTPSIVTRNMMTFKNWIPMSTAILSTEVVGWQEMPTLRRRQDYAYWLNLFEKNSELRCLSTNSTLATYRKRPNSLSSKPLVNLTSNYHMYRKALKFTRIRSAWRTLLNIISKILTI